MRFIRVVPIEIKELVCPRKPCMHDRRSIKDQSYHLLGPIKQEDGVGFPACDLGIKFSAESAEEHNHDVSIRICMCQREEDSAIGVEGGYQGQTRGDLLISIACGCTRRSPHSPIELSLVDPGLVYVDDSLSLFQKVGHPYGVLLSLYKTTLRIGLYRNTTCLPIAKLQLFSESFADF